MKITKIKILTIIMLCLTLGMASCKSKANEFDSSKTITRYSRDSESGTRDGFFTAIGFAEAAADDAKIPGYVRATDNANMISLINNDEYGIGYIALASLKESGLKAVNYEGITPSEEVVINGTYKLSRNFNYVTKASNDCTEDEWKLIRAFLLFTSSKEGIAIIKSKDGITTTSIASSKSFEELLNQNENKDLKDICAINNGNKIEIKFGGSTSVEKIAKALTEAFAKHCPIFKPTHNHTGSGAAFKGTQGGEKNSVNSLHIGFLSREFSNTETPVEGTYGTICKDGIVVVVNTKNTLITNLTKEQLKNIYQTNSIKWSDIIGNVK